MILAGIDYSMTSPGICVHDTNLPFTFENCQFSFMTPLKYLDDQVMDNVYGRYINKADFPSDIWRFIELTKWAMRRLSGVDQAALEGYSMGSRGRVFNIGENTGILKYAIHNTIQKPLMIFSPKEIKMFAVNNSPLDFSKVNKNKIDKQHMYDIFLEETGTDLQTILCPKKKKIDSPVSDIVDSFYICKLLRESLESASTEEAKSQSQ